MKSGKTNKSKASARIVQRQGLSKLIVEAKDDMDLAIHEIEAHETTESVKSDKWLSSTRSRKVPNPNSPLKSQTTPVQLNNNEKKNTQRIATKSEQIGRSVAQNEPTEHV